MMSEWVRGDGRLTGVSPGNFVDWRTQSRSFEQVAALDPFRDVTLTGSGQSERVAGAAVSADFFSLLKTPMAVGRHFTPEEDSPGRRPLAIISYGLWQRRFSGDRSIVGKSIAIDGGVIDVVGVLPRDFLLVGRASDFNARAGFDIWVPLGLNLQRLPRGTRPLRVLGRLRSGVTVAAVQAELDVLAAELERAHPANNGRGVKVTALSEYVAAGVGPLLWTLFSVVIFIWVMACVNVANLILARATTRKSEMAVRTALGAAGSRLLRQLITESLVLSSLAAVVGTAFAWIALRALVSRLPPEFPRTSQIELDAPVFVFIAAMSVLASIVCGSVALVNGRSTSEFLKASRQTEGRRHLYLRHGLVALQVALACVVLMGAGLMGRSLWNLLNIPTGFRANRVLTAELSLAANRYGAIGRIASFQSDVLARVATIPGVEAAGVVGYLPLSGTDNSWKPQVEGRPSLPPGDQIQYRPISPGYLEAMGIRLVAGRGFSTSDTAQAEPVVMVNDTAAKKYWQSESPLGRRIQIDGLPWRTVVGVVADVRHAGLDQDAKPELYLPYSQVPYPNTAMTLVVRSANEPIALVPTIRAVLAEIDSAVPLAKVQTMDEVVSASLGERVLRATLFSALAILALALAAIGIFGVLSYVVTQRRRELGVRLALGATPSNLVRLVFGQSAGFVGAGLGAGLVCSIALARIARSLLFGVVPADPLTLVLVSALIAAVAALATYVPARRAALTSPVSALRGD